MLDRIKDVVWINTGFLGDIVIQTGAIKLLKHCAPWIRQHLITTAIGSDALGGFEDLDNVVVFSKRESNFFAAAKAVKSQLGICGSRCESSMILQPHRSLRSSFLAKYLGLRTVTYAETQGSSLADIVIPRVSLLHETHRIALLLEPLGVDRRDIAHCTPSLTELSLDGTKEWHRFFDDDSKSIGVAPGSVWGTKRWPQESFKELIEGIVELDKDVKVVLLGSTAEMETCQWIYSSLPHIQGSLINLAGKTSLAELCGVVPKLDLMIANDSSPIHYASAFSVPTLALFGPTVSAMGFGPLAPKSRVLENSQVPCRPCGLHGPKVCPKEHFLCMRSLKSEAALEFCREILLKQ